MKHLIIAGFALALTVPAFAKTAPTTTKHTAHHSTSKHTAHKSTAHHKTSKTSQHKPAA
jgi:hypothetical protein